MRRVETSVDKAMNAFLKLFNAFPTAGITRRETTTQKKATKVATLQRMKQAKKNLSEIQKILRQYTPVKHIETVSTAGTWKDASQIMWDKETGEKFRDYSVCQSQLCRQSGQPSFIILPS